MSRTEISEYIFDRLKDSTTVLTHLGSMTSTNLRLYRAFPQHQPVLSAFEPGEGWLVFTVDRPTQIAADDILEHLGIEFQIVTTRPSIADHVIDTLDDLWNWRIWQQRSVSVGGYLLLFSKREATESEYTTGGDLTAARTDIHLYRRIVRYRWTVVKEEAEA